MYQGMVFLQDLEQTMELLAEVAVHAQYTEDEVRLSPCRDVTRPVLRLLASLVPHLSTRRAGVLFKSHRALLC